MSQVFSWPLETLPICGGGGSSCLTAGIGSSHHLSPGLSSFRAVRIPELFGVEGPSSSSRSTPCHRQGHLPLELQHTASLVPSDPPAAVLALATCTAPAPLQRRLSTCNCPLSKAFSLSAWRGSETTFLLWRKIRLVTDLSQLASRTTGRREAAACLPVQQGCCSETDFPRLLPSAQLDRPAQLPYRSTALDVTGKPQLPISPP